MQKPRHLKTKLILTFRKDKPAKIEFDDNVIFIEHTDWQDARFKVMKLLGTPFKPRGLDDYLGYDLLKQLLWVMHKKKLEEVNE